MYVLDRHIYQPEIAADYFHLSSSFPAQYRHKIREIFKRSAEIILFIHMFNSYFDSYLNVVNKLQETHFPHTNKSLNNTITSLQCMHMHVVRCCTGQ